jgi:hypothetical protein
VFGSRSFEGSGQRDFFGGFWDKRNQPKISVQARLFEQRTHPVIERSIVQHVQESDLSEMVVMRLPYYLMKERKIPSELKDLQ